MGKIIKEKLIYKEKWIKEFCEFSNAMDNIKMSRNEEREVYDSINCLENLFYSVLEKYVKD